MAQSKRQYFSVIAEPELGAPRGGDPETGGATSVAAVLRRARQQAGYALPDVATTLRIRLRYLEAIEDGRFDDLPGSVYAVGFIRTYAEFLNLDAEEMVRRFKDEVAGIDRQTRLNFPAPAAESRVPGGAVLLIAAVLALVAYGGWYYLSSAERGVGDLVPALPDRFAALLDEEPVALAPDVPTSEDPLPGTPVPSTPVPSTPAPNAALPDSAGPGAPVPDVPARDAPTAGVPAPADPLGTAAPDARPADAPPADTAPVGPRLAGAGDASGTASGLGDAAGSPAVSEPQVAGGAPVPAGPPSAGTPAPGPAAPLPPGAAQASSDPVGSIVIRAVADSWVQVRDAEGALVMTRVLRPGDAYTVPDRPGLTLVTGNAGGLEIVVDGRPAPAIGGPGDVVRGIALDGGRLLDGSAVGG